MLMMMLMFSVGPVCSPKEMIVSDVYGQYLAQMLVDEYGGVNMNRE
jgi:hypothetical protein